MHVVNTLCIYFILFFRWCFVFCVLLFYLSSTLVSSSVCSVMPCFVLWGSVLFMLLLFLSCLIVFSLPGDYRWKIAFWLILAFLTHVLSCVLLICTVPFLNKLNWNELNCNIPYTFPPWLDYWISGYLMMKSMMS